MKCRDVLYQNLDVSMVNNHFRQWGGIAWYVLERARSSRQQRLLEKAIDAADLDSLVDSCGRQLDANEAQISHSLLHFRVNMDFDMEYAVFVSEHVRHEVYKRLYETDKPKLLAFIAAIGWEDQRSFPTHLKVVISKSATSLIKSN
uniref:Uncharacterized protein n=1 Tax=Globisporangium ultimum (strain ATCC 200006 / CBS 805.95 / DAOM BR144) TaxID=431595 RepID=K3WFE9_GLOUD